MSEQLRNTENQALQRSREPPVVPMEASPRAAPEPPLLKEVLRLLAKIMAILITFLLIFTFIYGFFRNTDASMSPSVKDGDLVIFYRLDKGYVAQDTLVLKFEGQMQIRRVIATAGDTVDINENGLVINGAPQQETEIYESTHRYESGVEFPITLKEGQVFVLGDNRTKATDSRIYGAVEIKDTLGKAMTILRRRNI